MVERIFYWLLSLAFVVAVFFVIVSGFLYILSIGDSGTMGLAKEGLKYSLIGFVICLCSWLAIHLVYILLGYQGEEKWWQIECDSSETAQNIEVDYASKLYANEIPVDNLGGRNNPIALPDLFTQGLSNIPENKYFFIHGLGGQPLDQAANQLAVQVKSAAENKKIVYAAVPYTNTTGENIGTNLIKLNNYLASDQKKTLDNFTDLVLKLVAASGSLEVPLVVSQDQKEVVSFNNIWPENPDFYEGEQSIFRTLSTMTKEGLLYKETGPVVINWPDNKIPKNFSDFTINLDYDEKTGKYILNLLDPVIVTVPNNISPEAARAAARDFAKILVLLQKKQRMYSEKEDILTELTNLLLKNDVKKELTKNGEPKGNDSGYYRDFKEDKNGNVTKKRNWENNGTGILPSGIATKPVTGTGLPSVASGTNKNMNKELENLIREYLKNNSKNSSSSDPGSSNNQTSGSPSSPSTGSRIGTDTVAKESTVPISIEPVTGAVADPNSMVSLVSVGVSGPLSLEQRGAIRDLIINIQKEEYEKFQEGGKYKPLNIPPEYVLCLIQAESSFNPVAVSPTGAAGLGQHTDDSQKEAAEMMQQTTPKHYEEFSKKYGRDLTQLMSSRKTGLWNVKNTLRRDANLAAAMTYKFVEVKARNVLKLNGPVSMEDLRRITYRYIGDGNEGGQWTKIRNCMNSNSWASGGKKR
jgi:hypothetical protein